MSDLVDAQLTREDLARLGLSTASVAQADSIPALVKIAGGWRCQRCGQRCREKLADGRTYCATCLGLGRLTETDRLWRFPGEHVGTPAGQVTWAGQLTPAQTAAAAAVTKAVLAGRDHLLWAITGAGKTEMLFGVVSAILDQGGRVAWATPRVDVVLEIAPRLSAAFQTTTVVARYGGAPWPAAYAPLVVTTTHQLLRYYRAFDLIILDELDAFPYRGEPFLAYGVAQARRGPVVAVSATPPADWQRRSAQHTIGVSFLPRRFHGQPLPVPQVLRDPMTKGVARLSQRVLRQLTALLVPPQRLLLFVPDIAWLAPVARQLASAGRRVATVYAQDPERQAKVQALRRHALDCLITTTILERGVTIPHCAVAVLGADSGLFDAAALIQMAGRAGRDKASPGDPVWWIARHYSRGMIQAQHEINRMNHRPVVVSEG